MGGASSRAGVLCEQRIEIRGSKWCEEEELLSRAKRIDKVSLTTCGSSLGDRVDWSDLVQSCYSPPKTTDGATWLDTILLCAEVQAKIGEEKPKVTNSSSSACSDLIILDGDRVALEGLPSSILKINKPSQGLLMELVSKHPVVISIRCTERRGFEWTTNAEEAQALGYNPQALYCGAYDFHCIPRCALLVGYDKTFWTLFDPGFNLSFKLRRDEALKTGVSEFALVPM